MVNTRSSSRLDDDSPPSSATKTPSRRSPRIAAAKATMAADGKTPPTTGGSWRHVPSRLTLLWMAVSLPLVVWDTLYVLLRPLTMEGGALFWPLWVPYRLYGEVDHVYGWVAYNAKEGFTAAQGTLNAVETAMYLFYVYEIFSQSSGNSSSSSSGKDAGVRVLSGRAGARAALVGFSAAVMTLSKTVLYWANEYFSGFRHIGHNTAIDLFFLWIVPNGAWIVLPIYMIWDMGQNILDGLAAASGREKDE